MVRDRIPIQRPTAELPKEAVGLRGVIDGLKALYPDNEGHGPAILRTIKQQIVKISASPEELNSLKAAFDAKLSELVLLDMDKFPDKKTRMQKGMNEADRQNHHNVLRMFLRYDIPDLPMFSEERREELVVKAKQVIWAKGIVLEE